LYGNNNTIPNFWVGVVPFTDMVNIGTSHTDWMDSAFDSALDYGATVGSSSCPSYSGATVTHYGSGSSSRCSYVMSHTSMPTFGMTNWAGCVLARSSGTTFESTQADQYPLSGTANSLFKAYLYVSDATGFNGSNTNCTGGSNGWMCHQTTGSGSGQQTQTIY